MKYLFVAVLYLICASIVKGRLDESALNDDTRELITALHKQCIQKQSIDNDMIEKTHDGEFPNDQKLKCYMKCIMAEAGAMDENGNMDFTMVEEIVPDKLKPGIKNMFDQCVPKAKSADLCDRAFEFYSCCYKVDAKSYFLI